MSALVSIVTHNISIEQSVLGSLIFEPMLLMDVQGRLGKDNFYLPAHQAIYEAMLSLQSVGKPFDEPFIADFLASKNLHVQDELLNILSSNPISNIAAYVDQLLAFSQKRELMALSRTITQQLNESDDPEEVLQFLSKSINAISDLNSADYTLTPITQVPIVEMQFILKNWLPMAVGTVSLFVAPGGVGKSWLMIQAAIRYCLENPNKKAALWMTEDPQSETRIRAEALCQHVLHSAFNQLGNLEIFGNEDNPPRLLKRGEFNESGFMRIRKKLRGYGFVGLDPFALFYGGKENDNSEMNQVVYPFKRWALEDQINILFLHHAAKEMSNKQGSAARGASALVDGARVVYDIKPCYLNANSRELDPNLTNSRDVFVTKDNYGVIKLLNGRNKLLIDTTPPTKGAAVCVTYENIPKDKVELPLI